MSGAAWWGHGGERIHVIGDGTVLGVADGLPPTGTVYAARLDGVAMGDAEGVFTQFWEHLRFPVYFGWNWDALHDCLRDLGWLRADSWLIAVDAAHRVLAEDPGQRAVLFGVLAQAARDWGEVPFHVLLFSPPEHTARLRAEVGAARR